MVSTKLNIRIAEEKDAELIFHLISELAEYEKMSNEMVTDVDTLQESLFGERQFAETIIAEYEGSPVGFALFFHNFSTFVGRPGIYLEDLFVKPDYRGKGIGAALFTTVAKLAEERNCGRMEWSVLDWNEPAINFYKKLGAVAMKEWSTYRLDEKTLESISEKY